MSRRCLCIRSGANRTSEKLCDRCDVSLRQHSHVGIAGTALLSSRSGQPWNVLSSGVDSLTLYAGVLSDSSHTREIGGVEIVPVTSFLGDTGAV
jgi:hypothetical protein